MDFVRRFDYNRPVDMNYIRSIVRGHKGSEFSRICYDSRTLECCIEENWIRGAEMALMYTPKSTYLSLCLVQAKSVEMFELLMDHGASVTYCDSEWGRTPLFYAQTEFTIRMLVGWGADVNAKDREGKTPLEYNMFSSERINVLLQLGSRLPTKFHPGFYSEQLSVITNVYQLRNLLPLDLLSVLKVFLSPTEPGPESPWELEE
jgi:hypothetical protein